MADTLNNIKCPACQEKMEKVFIPHEGVNVDICIHGCGGIYFDTREFKYFDEQHERIDEITKAIEGKTFNKVDESLPRTCPACGARMVKNYSSAKKNIQVDDCYACGGKFLDNGELQKIRAEYATESERTKEVMNMIYDTVGVQIKAMDEEHAIAQARRSPMKKLFDKMVGL